MVGLLYITQWCRGNLFQIESKLLKFSKMSFIKWNSLFFIHVKCFVFIGLILSTISINHFYKRHTFLTFDWHLLSEMYHNDDIVHDTCIYTNLLNNLSLAQMKCCQGFRSKGAGSNLQKLKENYQWSRLQTKTDININIINNMPMLQYMTLLYIDG